MEVHHCDTSVAVGNSPLYTTSLPQPKVSEEDYHPLNITSLPQLKVSEEDNSSERGWRLITVIHPLLWVTAHYTPLHRKSLVEFLNN